MFLMCRSALSQRARRSAFWRGVLCVAGTTERRFRARVGALPVRSRIAQNNLFGAVRQLAAQAPFALAAASTWTFRFGHDCPTQRLGHGAGPFPLGIPL